MGKAARRALHKHPLVVDGSDTASNEDLQRTESIQEDGEEDEETVTPEWSVKSNDINDALSENRTYLSFSPYLTRIVSVVVGCPPKEFNVHAGVLSKSTVLEAQCQALHPEDHLFLTDVEPPTFELALCYLYSGDYCEHCPPCQHPGLKKVDPKAAAFQQHSLLYCFARKYKLDRLINLTTKNIKSLGQIGYQSVFSSAKEIYRQLPEDDFWFRNSFKQETIKALMDNGDLVHEPWLLDTFREQNGSFTFDLFTALTGAYEKIISTGIGFGTRPHPAWKLARWFSPNMGHSTGTSSADSSPADWSGEDSTSDRGSISDETDHQETMSVPRYSYMENLGACEDPPCIIQAELTDAAEDDAVAEALPANEAVVCQRAHIYNTEPPQDVTRTPAPEGVLDLDLLLAAETCQLVERGRKKCRGRYRFSREGAHGVAPVPEPAFTAEQVTVAEKRPSRTGEPSAGEPAARNQPTEEPPPDYDEAVPADVPVEYGESPAPHAEGLALSTPGVNVGQELRPMSAAEEAPDPAELRPEPLWAFSSKKARKRAKKRASWFTYPAAAPPLSTRAPAAAVQGDSPSDPDILNFDPELVSRREESPFPPDSAYASPSRLRYASSVPIFKYTSASVAAEGLPPPDDDIDAAAAGPCTRRAFHFAGDARGWVECQQC